MTIQGFNTGIRTDEMSSPHLTNFWPIVNEINDMADWDQDYEIHLVDSIEDDFEQEDETQADAIIPEEQETPGDLSDHNGFIEELLDHEELNSKAQEVEKKPKMNPASGRKRATGKTDRAFLAEEPEIIIPPRAGRMVRVDKKTEMMAREGDTDQDVIDRYFFKYPRK